MLQGLGAVMLERTRSLRGLAGALVALAASLAVSCASNSADDGAAEPDAGAVQLCVRDSGGGISPEDLPYVFERFYRGDEARQQQDSASGLGLAIAKSLVQAHGGSISVESVLGKGTSFTITIPHTA